MPSRNGADLDLEVENLVGDLVSTRKNQPFLEGLFAAPKGTWLPVQDLCAETEVEELLHRLSEALQVTWLDYPEGSADFSLVLFLRESCMWSKAVAVNRSLVVAKKKKNIAKARR